MKTVTINNVQINEEALLKAGYVKAPETVKRCRWKPKDGDIYWFYSDNYNYNCGVYTYYWDGDEIDRSKFALGNVFKTKEEAILASKKVIAKQKVIDKLREIESCEKISWDKQDQRKYFITFNYRTARFVCHYTLFEQVADKDFYTTDEKALIWIINNMEKELKLIFGVNEK